MTLTKKYNKISLFSLVILIEKIFPFLLIPFFTNYLTLDELGKYSLFFVFFEVFFAFSNFSAQEYILVTEEKNLDKNISNSFLLILVSSLFLSLIFFILNIYFSIIPTKLLFCGIIILISRSVFNLFYGVFRTRLDIKNFSMNVFLSSILAFISSLYFGLKNGTYMHVIFGIAFANFLTIILMYFYVYRNYLNSLSLDYEAVIDQIKFAVPISFSRIGMWLNQSANKVIISFFLDDFSVGILTSSMIYFSMIEIIADSCSKGLIPYIYKNRKDVNYSFYSFKKMKRIYYLIIFSAFCITLINIEFIWFNIFSNPNFNNLNQFILIIMLSGVLKATTKLNLSFLYLEKQTVDIFKIYLLTGLINIILCYFLVKSFGLFGVAFAFFVSSIVQFILIKIKFFKLNA